MRCGLWISRKGENNMNEANEIYVDMCYYYKGSSNVRLNLIEKIDGIDLVTDYGEVITTVTSGYGLMRVLEDLYENKYA
jgi:hypothetical protein